ncbi:DUF2784 domain-containing protein [Halalkalibaculum sp. DA3122]|uniref:DUF2784 domain-containing protein n=1 Tax=unclassified Halalkalibaculum TaxID=2964617 RepID=UPI003753F3C6
MYQFLDLFFIIFHTLLVLFNLFGWIWKKTRWLNFLTLSLTAFSWIVLGIWYGFGYCPCTHWHWLVRRELGHYDMPNSYIKFLVDLFTGWDVSPLLVDWATGISFLAAFCISLYLNYRDHTLKNR